MAAGSPIQDFSSVAVERRRAGVWELDATVEKDVASATVWVVGWVGVELQRC